MKRSFFALFLIIILMIIGCSQNSNLQIEDASTETSLEQTPIPEQVETQKEKNASTKSTEKVIVNTIDELLAEITSGKYICLVPGGKYDLNAVKADTKYFKNGTFEGLKDVTIEGIGERQVDFLTSDISNDVLAFTDCTNIRLINLNLGHIPPNDNVETCEGRVLCFYGDCNDIYINNCTMFGCGTTGIYFTNVNNMVCENSVIKECSYTIMDLLGLKNGKFTNCRFEKNSSYYIEVGNVHNVIFNNCLFTGYYSPPIFGKYQNNRMQYSEPLYGEVNKKEIFGIQLQNSSFETEKTDSSNSVPLQAFFNNVSRDLRKLYPESECICGLSNVGDKETSTIEIEISLNSIPLNEEYQKTIYSIMDVLLKYSIKEEFELGLILKADRIYNYLSYTNLSDAIDNYKKDKNNIFKQADYIYFEDIAQDFNLILNNDKTYLSINEAKEIILRELPDYFTNDKYVPDLFVDEYRYNAGNLYYYLADKKELKLGFFVDAAEGTIMRFFEGDYYKINPPSEELKEAVIKEYYKNKPDASAEMIFICQINEHFIELHTQNDYTFYLIKNENDNYILEEYCPWD